MSSPLGSTCASLGVEFKVTGPLGLAYCLRVSLGAEFMSLGVEFMPLGAEFMSLVYSLKSQVR